MSLFWKVKVVRSVTATITLVFTFFTVHSQSVSSSKITYSCKSMNLEAVIEQLSKITGLYFIYSSNKVQLNKPVSLSVINKSVEEVMALLGKQLNLSFNLQGNHVVIKTVGKSLALQETSISSTKKSEAITTNTVKNFPIPTIGNHMPSPEQYSERIFTAYEQLPSKDYFERHLARFTPYYDSTLLKRIPVQHTPGIKESNRYSKWFISIGLMVNDYSTGIEIQLGHRWVYAVFSPGWLRDKRFYRTYGLGTSLSLFSNISFNPVYSYSFMNEKGIYDRGSYTTKSLSPTANVYSLLAPYEMDRSINHHQVKLMMQYRLTPHLNISLGPTVNQARITYRYAENIFVTDDVVGWRRINTAPAGNMIFTAKQITSISQKAYAKQFWLGWQVSFSYKINFLHRQ